MSMLEKNYIPASELALVEAEELGASTEPPGLAARTTESLLLRAPITATLSKELSICQSLLCLDLVSLPVLSQIKPQAPLLVVPFLQFL
jgi:hypothetical protein